MNELEKTPTLVCQICGKAVIPEEAVPYLTGMAHIGCKGKTEEEMREGSDTIYGKS